VGIYTYEAVVTSIWSQGIFQYKTKKQLKAIAHGVQALQTTQNRFKNGTYSRLDDIGSAVGAIENTLNDLWQQSSTVSKPTFKAAPECGRTLLPYVRNGDFVGRKAIVEDIEHKLGLPNSNNRCAIWGLGGIGYVYVPFLCMFLLFVCTNRLAPQPRNCNNCRTISDNF